MPLQNFVDNAPPTIQAGWLNGIDNFYFTLFNSATTAANARTAIQAAQSGVNADITSLASPALASATAVTQSPGDSTTKVATTAFIAAALVGIAAAIKSAVNVFTKNQSVLPVAVTPGSAPDFSLSNNFTFALTSSFTMPNPINFTDGMIVNMRIVQPAGGGAVVTWGSMYKFAGGSANGVLSTAGNAVDFVSMYVHLPSSTLDCVLNRAFS